MSNDSHVYPAHRARRYRPGMINLVKGRPCVEAARDLAEELLVPLGDRWRHTVAVAGRAAEIRAAVMARDAELLVAVAWLHDIGYAPAARVTGFHPLDGA